MRPPAPENEHEGFEYVAEVETSESGWHAWETVAPDEARPCRFDVGPRHATCKNPSVAKLNRGTPSSPRWYHYCAEPSHMYGRWVEDGKVMCWVLREVVS